MKSRISMEKAVPVPARGKVIIVSIGMFLLMASIYVGTKIGPESDIPVALANGDVITPPYYITIDGEKAVLVESRDAAEAAINGVIEEYKGDREEILDIQIREEAQLEKMEISNGDEPPEILTAAEATKELLSGNDGDGYLTVVVTREEVDRQTINYEEEYKPAPNMYVGEKKIETEGENGVKEVTKKVVTENGETVDTEIIDEETLKEPVQQVTLTGTKPYDGYGGGEGAIDAGVSYDEDAVYDILKTPVPSVCITSKFGPRWGRTHGGIDLALAQGSDIYAADSGTVYCAAYSGGYGNLIKIDHGNGMQTYYAHCSRLLVSEGQKVKRGQKIALAGSTGNSTGPHLHFEVIINGVRVDPLDFLDLQ